MDAYVPTPSTSANTKLGLFGQERFTYAPEKDGYRGPRGEELTLRFDTTALGRHLRYDATAGSMRICSSAWRRGSKPPRNHAGEQAARCTPLGHDQTRQ
jgi:hypothetical protein